MNVDAVSVQLQAAEVQLVARGKRRLRQAGDGAQSRCQSRSCPPEHQVSYRSPSQCLVIINNYEHCLYITMQYKHKNVYTCTVLAEIVRFQSH